MSFIGDLERFLATSLYPNRVPIAIGLAVLFVVAVVVARRRGWFAAARRHPGRTGVAVALTLAIGLPAGWYLGSPIFIRTSLDEPAPTAAAPSPTPPASPTAAPTGPTASGSPAVPTPTPAPTLAAPRSGTFTGADEFHFGSGTATLIETAPGAWTVRFENFSVRNGPDLFVYLSADPAGYDDAAIDLGRLKATDGNFNMDLPAGSTPTDAASVVIWCKQFAVQFAVAPLGG
ncbi:MAG: DM13 domain-containing protein [Chloroflexi bacterium]|nr:DM13 domain-containing protein [Chloroflexota bacterium]